MRASMRFPRNNKIRRDSTLYLFVSRLTLAVLLLMLLLPFLLLLNTALKTPAEFLKSPTALFTFRALPEMLTNFTKAFDVLNIGTRFFYTLFIALISATLSCVVVTLIAYPLARGHFRGSNRVFVFVLASTFFPGSLVANIFLVRALGLYNNPLVLVLFWGLGGLAVYIFMTIQYIRGLPVELDESAFMDGCGYFRYILQFILPLSKTILITVFIMRFIGAWNDFLTPYIYLLDSDYMTISTGLYCFKGQFANNWPGAAAATLTVALPVVILYILMQKYIIRGVTSGALKV